MQVPTETIGFVGLGPMGHGMAKNIVQKGLPLVVYGHRRREPVESLVGFGATEASSLADLGQRASIVFLCLPSSIEVEETVLGAEGLAASMVSGKVIVDCSTSNPVSTLNLAAELVRRGIGFLDAPLTRSAKEAEAGRLNVIAGGDPDVIARVRPIIDLFAENVFLSGEIASAHKLKLINNFMSIGCSLVVSEAVLAAKACGVDPRLLHELASQGGANSGAFQQIMPWVLDGQMNFRFAIRNARKDLGYYSDMVPDPRPVETALTSVLQALVADGVGDLFMPQIIDVLERGTPPKSEPTIAAQAEHKDN